MKVRSLAFSFILLFSAVFVVNGASKETESADYKAVKTAVEQSIGWAIEKDFEAMLRLWDENMLHFWLFSNSLVVGKDSFEIYAEQWKDPDFRGTRFEFRDLRITFSSSGDVAWYSCFLDDCGTFKGTEFCLENVFQTGVLEKKDGRWLHALMHGSYPVDKVPENYVRMFYSDLIEKGEIENPYFGQTPPGDTAEIFAEDVISLKGRYEYGISFSPKGDEMIFGATEDEKTALYHSRNIDGTWTAPQKISLSEGAFSEEMEAFFTPDGKHIYFAPYNEGMDVRIWGVDITENGWQNPRKLNDLINSGPVFYPVCAANNNLYFTHITKKKVCKATYEDGKHTSVEEFDFPFGGHLYIAPDESFALIDGKGPDTLGKGDIHVIFKDEDGNWKEPVNLGQRVNSEFSETCPSLTSDGKYILFSRYNDPNGSSDFYWVDAKILDEFK